MSAAEKVKLAAEPDASLQCDPLRPKYDAIQQMRGSPDALRGAAAGVISLPWPAGTPAAT